MFLLIYNIFLTLGFPIVIAMLLTKKRCQRGILARLGKVPRGLQGRSGRVVWVHAASLGEVTAVIPLIRAMKEEDPGQDFVVSTVTETGREMVLNRLQGVARHCYAPLDFWWAVTRYIRVLNPGLFLLVESEIWPNLLTSLQQHQVPVCLVNGRISSRSFSRYRIVKNFMKTIWSSLDMALMQTAQDAERIEELGAYSTVVHVTGNMKFDQSFEYSTQLERAKTLRTSLGISDSERVLVAGSTHHQEEEYLLDAYHALCDSQENVVLVMAPRHIERAPELEAVIARFGLRCVRRSQMDEKKTESANPQCPRVILLDSRGELPYAYGLGIVSFVGGTLVPVGGHNVLEPAQWARPVIFGPYIDHCRESANQLLQAGGAIHLHQPEELVGHFQYLLDHPSTADQMGQQALSVIQANRGVMEKNLRMIRQLTLSSGSIVPGSGSSGFGSSVPHADSLGNRDEYTRTISF
ncbi:MAG: 3-deoxy-D-manno-octulosonic acid transferase [Nitrospirales bacterium]